MSMVATEQPALPVARLECSERGAAEHYVRLFADLVGYVPEWGFVVYQRRRWERDFFGQPVELAMQLSGIYRAEATRLEAIPGCHSDALAAARFARHLDTATGIRNVLTLVKPLVPTRIAIFDAVPMVVTCRNCTLDFSRVGEDRRVPDHASHYQGHYVTCWIRHDWHMGAPAPLWAAFLERIFPDPALRDFIQRAVGYSMLGTMREQCVFICHGCGANGKSTFLNALRHVLGPEYGHQADPRTFTTARSDDAIRNDLADLRAVRLVAAIETGRKHTLDEDLVKQATGGENIRARHLFHEAFEYTPQFKLWLATNHIPRVRGTDDGIWRRIRLIPFQVAIPEEEQDRDLPQRLAREAEGILAWMVEGAVEYLVRGLGPPDIVRAATTQYRFDQDVVGTFIEECIRREKGATTGASELYQAFLKWSGQPMSQSAFGGLMTEKGIERVTLCGRRYYRGVKVTGGAPQDLPGLDWNRR